MAAASTFTDDLREAEVPTFPVDVSSRSQSVRLLELAPSEDEWAGSDAQAVTRMRPHRGPGMYLHHPWSGLLLQSRLLRRNFLLLSSVVALLASTLLLVASYWLSSSRGWTHRRDVVREQDKGTLLVQLQDKKCCTRNKTCHDCTMRLPCLGKGGLRSSCAGHCQPEDDTYDYFGGDLYSIGNVASSTACCSHCRAEPNCTAWTWGKTEAIDAYARRRCFLKRQLELRRVKHFSSTSGFPGFLPVTFLIKSRHGLCMAQRGDDIVLQECAGASSRSQQWTLDMRLGRIKSQDGRCLGSPQWKMRGGVVHLRPCQPWILGQHWILEGHDGLIQNRAGFCVSAVEATKRDSRLQMDVCDANNHGHQWSMWFTSSLDDPSTQLAMMREAMAVATTTTFQAPGVSLFCYALMLPSSEEEALMKVHASKQRGIFACEEAAVYSSVVVDLGNGYRSQVLPHTNVWVEKGGEWGTYLNTPVFVAVWRKIQYTGRYKYHDWVIKVDPDTVFLPTRLRRALADGEFREAEINNGAIIYNCGYALHGPIEVVSQRAMDVFTSNMAQCSTKPQEDFFLSDCTRSLGVQAHFRADCLADRGCQLEDNSAKDPNWWQCQSGHAAFHPFKTSEELEGCYARAAMISA
mmetsp:Transcript_27883/g.88182  ORF Transcript_27883/g.88182 Transcript_27883/m.88182 type:complete len:633 (-) Transcript_27883:144-2042(-)